MPQREIPRRWGPGRASAQRLGYFEPEIKRLATAIGGALLVFALLLAAAAAAAFGWRRRMATRAP